jgi:hypothetical protein
MDRKLKTAGERIKFFAKKYYGGIGKLASFVNMPQSTFSQYTSKKNPQNPGHDFLKKMYDSGCSVNWILFGDGDIFAHNETGIKLKKADIVDSKVDTNSSELKINVLSEKELKVIIRDTVLEVLNLYK